MRISEFEGSLFHIVSFRPAGALWICADIHVCACAFEQRLVVNPWCQSMRTALLVF